MSLRRAVVLFVLVGFAACSRAPERATVMSPTGPSAVNGAPGALLAAPVPAAGKLDAIFPSRANTFDFYQRLIAKYRDGLRRSGSPTFIDPEGIVVWIQEYFRYVANGCDHATSVQRVFAQIDGSGPGALCAPPPPDTVVQFPPRDQSFAFALLLDQKYQQMGRPLGSSFVDLEGSIIWTQEYLRYFTNACDHETSIAKVLTQIDGNPPPAVCFVPPCKYQASVNPVVVPGGGGQFSVIMFRRSGECDWTAKSNSSFITLKTAAGGSAGPLEFTVAPNNGSPRSGTILVEYTGGSVEVVVNQSGPNFKVLVDLFDFNKSSGATNECDIVLPSHNCTFKATSLLPEGPAEFNWKAEYNFNGLVSPTQVGTSNTFVVNTACGGTGSSAEGAVVEIVVTLKVTDTGGNTATIVSGQDGFPSFYLRFRTCS